MIRPLPAALAAILATGAAMADTPDYSLTVYSAAQPGQLSTANLANYGLNLPGYALVRDSRRMTLPSGTGDVRFTDVAKRIDPTTVAFESLSDPAGTRVIEQNYQYDLVDNAKLLDRYGDRLEYVLVLDGWPRTRTTPRCSTPSPCTCARRKPTHACSSSASTMGACGATHSACAHASAAWASERTCTCSTISAKPRSRPATWSPMRW